MGLEWSALTTASHVVLVLSVLLLFQEAMMLRHVVPAAKPARSQRLFYAGAWIMAAFVVERLYYVAARLLLPEGVDLWAMHPAPEFLSAMVAAAVFGAFATITGLTSPILRRARSTVAIHGAFLVGVWTLVAWFLW